MNCTALKNYTQYNNKVAIINCNKERHKLQMKDLHILFCRHVIKTTCILQIYLATFRLTCQKVSWTLVKQAREICKIIVISILKVTIPQQQTYQKDQKMKRPND